MNYDFRFENNYHVLWPNFNVHFTTLYVFLLRLNFQINKRNEVLVQFITNTIVTELFFSRFTVPPFILETEAVFRRCLRNFAKFIGKYLCRRLFFNKVAGLTPFFTEHLWWLLLQRVPFIEAWLILNSTLLFTIFWFTIEELSTIE